MIVSARDLVAVLHYNILEDDSILIVVASIDNGLEFMPEQKNVVRAHLEIGGWLLRSVETGTETTYVTEVDLKGNVPASIVKLGTKMMGEQIPKLRDTCKKFLRDNPQ
mmetsp:Transcript_45494/g.33267  ORF Transcript_45494/g.33267 Transcript_45494/m.33267 type:complete len:108 (+) Transcript_45494:1827-2150(+)